MDALVTEEEDTDEDEEASAASRRRTPAEADALRARMVVEGYPLSGIVTRDNNRIWVSLTQHRRWSQLQALTGMTDAELRTRIKAISQQHYALTERK